METSHHQSSTDAERFSEQRFRSLFESALDAILLTNADGAITAANPAACVMFGMEEQELINAYIGGLFELEDSVRAALNEDGKRAGMVRAEFTCIRKNRTRFPTEVQSVLFDKESDHAFVIIRDITERKQAEDALAAARISAEQAKATAESANRAKDHFLAVLSHELRTPLNPALMAATILERDPQLPPDLREDIEMIRRNIELEARLIDDMLDLTRISLGKLTLLRRIVDGTEILNHAIKICKVDIVQKYLSFSVELPSAPIHVHADPARLQQVFWNVIKNAVKFTPDHGRIKITATLSNKGDFRVEVADSGKGIDKEALPLIFEAFEQGHASVTERYGGLGLGLAICKGLMNLHEGTISAKSDGAGRGATFIVELPTVNQDLGGKIPLPHQGKVPTTSMSHAAFHILLVEDHESSAVVTAKLLRSKGYKVTVADCVKLALEKFTEDRGNPIDLVLSDLGLPDGSGESLLQQILAQRPVKAIALSGYGMDSDIQNSAKAGFAAHLTKPLNAALLEETVARILAPARK